MKNEKIKDKRMYFVESKYKNPDKYVKTLKNKIERLGWQIDSLGKQIEAVSGKYWVTFDPPASLRAEHSDVSAAQKGHIGEEISIRGRICKMEIIDEEAWTTFEVYTVHLLG